MSDKRLETTLLQLTDSEVLVPHGVEPDDALAHLALQVVEPQVRQELHVRVHRQVRGKVLAGDSTYIERAVEIGSVDLVCILD